MKKIYYLISLIVSAALLCGGCSAGGEMKKEETEMNNWERIEEAYIFAFPLVLLDATARYTTNTVETTDTKAPVNQLIHASLLANATTKFVVTPNVDTIYTQVFFDFSEDALVYKKPAADRFFSAELLDAYTNCVRVLGTGGDTQEEKTYLLAGPDFDGEVPDGMELVSFPTNNAWMLARVLVNGDDDLENVFAIQRATELVPLSAYGKDYTPPKGTYDEKNEFVPIDHVLAMSPEEFFARANELMIKNPPSDADREAVAEMEKVGVGAGLTFDPAVLGGDSAKWKEFMSGLVAKLTERSAPFMEKMGLWEFWGEPVAEFGTEYDYRALIAIGGLGANPVSIAVYPKASTDDKGQLLDGKNSYTLHFDAPPPVKEHGFWSITAYGEDNFLIDNELDRYAINDRSNLKYNADGSLDILIQAQPPEDESMMGNWLPVKTEQFHLHLRVYLPEDSLLDGGWTAPGISAN